MLRESQLHRPGDYTRLLLASFPSFPYYLYKMTHSPHANLNFADPSTTCGFCLDVLPVAFPCRCGRVRSLAVRGSAAVAAICWFCVEPTGPMFCNKDCQDAYAVRAALASVTRLCLDCSEFWPRNVSECPNCGHGNCIAVHLARVRPEQLP